MSDEFCHEGNCPIDLGSTGVEGTSTFDLFGTELLAHGVCPHFAALHVAQDEILRGNTIWTDTYIYICSTYVITQGFLLARV